MRSAVAAVLVLVLVVACSGLAIGAVFVISDFETDPDLAQWEPTGAIVYCPDGYCDPTPATLSRVPTHATHGSYSCQITMPPPPSDFPGMNMISFPVTDWSAYDVLRMDFYNPTPGGLVLHVEISDSVAGNSWPKRYYAEMALIPGVNHIEIDVHNMSRNDGSGNVDPGHISRFTFYVTGFAVETTVYYDYVRLETVEDDPWADAAREIYKFDFGTGSSPRWPDFFRVTASDNYAAVPGWGWTDSAYRYSGDMGGPDNLCRDFVRPLPCCPTSSPLEFRLDLPDDEYTVYLIARSGELHGMPVLGWQILAEGATKVDVPMDSSIFYTTDYYYRGMDEDYPLSETFFDKFVNANYPAYKFTATVGDGALNLTIYRAWAYVLIVYPTSLESEMGPRLAGWEADRRTQLESTYYVSTPAERTFTPTPEETARGYAAWPVATMDPCCPDTLPPSPRPSLSLSAAAAQDERRPVTLAIRPLADLSDVSISVSDLSDGAGHTIPSSEIDRQYVRYLATPNTEFFGPGVLSWKPRLLQSDLPIAIKSQVTKQFWLTIHVPNGTPAGSYTGTVTVYASSGNYGIPLTLEVWPFQLDRADDMAYGWYYTSPDDRYCFNTRWFPDMAAAGDAMLRLDFAHMKEHGYNSLQFPSPYCSSIDPDTGWVGPLDESQKARYGAAMEDIGFGGQWKGQVGTINIANQILSGSSVSEFDDDFDVAFKDVLGRMVASGESDGYPLVMYLVDEPRESMIQGWNRNFADTMQYCDLANQVDGVVSTVTVMADSEEGVDYTPIADETDIIQTHPWPNSAGLIAHARAQGKPIWFYNTGGDLRMVYGFYQYKWGNGCWEWHFDWLDEGWDPFPYSPFNNHWHYTYPSPDGPVSTLNYEWGSLGIVDYRYAATLERLSEEARATGMPDMVAWANEADALLRAITSDVPDYAVDESYQPYHFAGIADGSGCLTQVDAALESYRRQIAELITRYGIPTPGEDCEVTGADFPDSMVWGETAEVSLTYRNLTDEVWQPADGYHLLAADSAERWGLTEIALGDSVEANSTYSFDFAISSPPWTTLQYLAEAGPTTPAVADAFPCDWVLAKEAGPLSGGLSTHSIAVSRFPDIQPGLASAWARSEIEECAGRVPFIVQGYPDGGYHGDWPITRGAMAVFIARAAKYELSDVAEPPFPDVSVGYWAVREIGACVRNGVVQGYADGFYRPGVTVTRDQMAVYVQRACRYDLPTLTGNPFPDVPRDSWAAREVKACVEHYVVKGYPDGLYRPAREVSRDQMAVFVYRAFVQPTASVVVLGGPGLTRLLLGAEVTYPGDAIYYGWPPLSGASEEDRWVYVALDAARLGPSLAGSVTWDVVVTVRNSSDEVVAERTVALTADHISGANQAVNTSNGCPYLVIAWQLPRLSAVGVYEVEVTSTSGSITRDKPLTFAIGDLW